MNSHYHSTEHAEQEARVAYLCGCRVLQWMTERLPVDRSSCVMRGMSQEEWYQACCMLIEAGIIDSRLELLVSLPKGMLLLRRHFDAVVSGLKPEEESDVGAQIVPPNAVGLGGQSERDSCTFQLTI